MSVEKNLVRYTWSKESLNKNYEYVRALYSYKSRYANPTNVSVSATYTKEDMFDFRGSITRIPYNSLSITLDGDFVRKYSFFKFSSRYYLDYCWEYLDDMLCDRLDDYKFSVYYNAHENCIYLMDNIKVMDVLVNSEIIETVGGVGSSCKADVDIGFSIEEVKNKEEIINIIVEALSEFREEDAIYYFLNNSDYASISFNTYMPSSSYEVRFRDDIVRTDLIEAVRKRYDYWKNKFDNFEDAIREALYIKDGINVKIDYNLLYASGISFDVDKNRNSYWPEIDFSEVEDEVLSEKVSEVNFKVQLDMNQIISILEDYKEELEDAKISIYRSISDNKDLYVGKENEIYRIPAFILFHALSMQGFYCDNEIHSFIDTLKDADNILGFYIVNDDYSYKHFNFDDLELIIGNENVKNKKVIEELYLALEDDVTFIKYDQDKSTIKVAIKTSFFEDLWNYRDKIDEIVSENTKDDSIKDVTIDFYVSTYDTIDDIEANSMYSFSDKYIYMDEKLAKSDHVYLYAMIVLHQ